MLGKEGAVEEPLGYNASEHAEKQSAGKSTVVGEISFFKLRELVRKVYRISQS